MRGEALAALWSGPEAGFSLVSQPVPQLRRGEILVAVELATICGSDLHTIAGDRSTPLPTVLGHEAVGHVVATGGPVIAADGAEVALGQRVTWTIGASCGSCRRCLRGIPQKCATLRKYGHEATTEHWRLNGGLATHCHLLPGTGVVTVPEALPAAVAAPANCATATVVCAARRVGLGPDDVVVVLGCGMLGITAVAYARDLGVATVIACDVDPDRRASALRFGASAACGPDQVDALVDQHGADVIFELSGSNQAVSSALELVDVGGRVALVGSVSPTGQVGVHPEQLVRRLTTVVGSHNYALRDLVEAVAFLSRSPLQHEFADLVRQPFPLAEIETAFRAARDRGALRVPVHPG